MHSKDKRNTAHIMLNSKTNHKLPSSEPCVSVGIMHAKKVQFCLHTPFRMEKRVVEGQQCVCWEDGLLLWNGHQYLHLEFLPQTSNDTFTLENVTIGVQFHWERQEQQTFKGTLRLMATNSGVQVINELPVEQYLESVISSEMSATSSMALLCAHAIISRSWLLTQMERRAVGMTTVKAVHSIETDKKWLRWYDREDHTLFDVCADDHCQRYQGTTRATSSHVAEAIKRTRGCVLTFDDKICDARFSKCCGGVMEEFSACWEDKEMPYLQALADNSTPHKKPNLCDEVNAQRWIKTSPTAYCNTRDAHVLAQVLNDYDQETTDFYRWQVTIEQEDLQLLLHKKLHLDLGKIRRLTPLKRGKSGRIWLLRIEGEEGIKEIGKELEIRRALSTTHLYSSAFVVEEKNKDADGFPTAFLLHGAGWGHGVGLCQIGAAMMAEEGKNFEEILHHYYPGATITSLYP